MTYTYLVLLMVLWLNNIFYASFDSLTSLAAFIFW